MNVIVTSLGNCGDPSFHGGIPYYFFQAGKQKQHFQQVYHPEVNLNYVKKRNYWRLKRLIGFKMPKGFQYSFNFLNTLDHRIPLELKPSCWISFNQVFPLAEDIKKQGGLIFYYIDATLINLKNNPDYNLSIAHDIWEEAFQREKKNYQHADKIVIRSSWIKETLKSAYKIPANKIIHILPGANFPEKIKIKPKKSKKADDLIILGFIGKDWKRKGLPLVVDIKNQLKARGLKVKINVIGYLPDYMYKDPDINYKGFINKSTQLNDFVSVVQECDLGTLFSTTEAFGLSAFEFIRLGVPVAGYDHQGLKDSIPLSAGFRYDLQMSADQIANQLFNYFMDKHSQASKINGAMTLAAKVTWKRCIDEWKVLLNE